MEKKDIKSMLLPELRDYFGSIGERPFRAEQVFSWLHKGVRSFSGMTNLPEVLRDRLDCEFRITVPELVERLVSVKDGTTKFLWRLADGAVIESVLMDYAHGSTVCISTQVGCRMGCAFCASSIGGLERDLAASEMLDQVLFSQSEAGKRVSNVVLMGIGEPLDNFKHTMRFLELVSHPAGLNIGARHISVSTCGIIENIDKMAQYDVQFTLSVSLHAPDDETRSLLMPINLANGVDKLLEACGRFFEKTGRRVSYEYALIDGVNDSLRHAGLLAKKLKRTGGHLNLILLSHVPERQYRASPPGSVRAFTGFLEKSGVNYTVRRSLGADIEASCGQLRRRRVLSDTNQ